MIAAFHETMPELLDRDYRITAWVNTLPPGAVTVIGADGFDYTAYCAKPFAMAAAAKTADIVILLDAAFYPIRDIQPLVDHIATRGYYFCDNGARVGNWASDACLLEMLLLRDDAMKITEISSYCVGLDMRVPTCRTLLEEWMFAAKSPHIFPGSHTNTSPTTPGVRNAGWISADERCKGHRHDQTALSIIAHRLKMDQLCGRPLFTTYEGSEDHTTVLVNRGL